MLTFISFVVAILCLVDGVSGEKKSSPKLTGKLHSSTSEFLNVTLAIFSGLQDPQWVLYNYPVNQVYQNIKGRLDKARKNGLTSSRAKMPAVLGYKGFLVSSAMMTEPELVIGPNTVELQKLLLQTMPQEKKLDHIKDLLLGEIEKSVSASPAFGRKKRVAPAYDPDPWNAPNRLTTNNCYNYATNLPSLPPNTFARPGRHSNHPIPIPFTGADVQRLAEFDGLVTLSEEFTPNVGGTFTIPPQHAATGHLVALVVSPPEFGLDFHWYRLDSGGNLWSHKPGATQVSRLDGLNNQITDPRTAASRPVPRYQFVCFMVKTANTQIR